MFFKKDMYEKYMNGDGFDTYNRKLDGKVEIRIPDIMYRDISYMLDSANTINLRFNGGLLESIKLSDYYSKGRRGIVWHALAGHIAHWVVSSSAFPKKIGKGSVKTNKGYNQIRNLLFFAPDMHGGAVKIRVDLPLYAIEMASFEPWAVPKIPFGFTLKLGLLRYMLDEPGFKSVVSSDDMDDFKAVYYENFKLLLSKYDEILRALNLKL